MAVYLIHLDTALGNPQTHEARHYVGFALDVARRCHEHEQGIGSALLRAATERGIPWHVVRTWEGGRPLERRIKARKAAPELCPVCSGPAALARGNYPGQAA